MASINLYMPFRAEASITRPADTTQYAVGDAIAANPATVLQFNIGEHGEQHFVITRAVLVSSVKGSTLLSAKLHLFNVTFTPTADNAAIDFTDAVSSTGGMKITFGDQHGVVSNSMFESENIWKQGKLAVGDTKIYGQLEALNTYTPASGEELRVILFGFLLSV